MGNMKDCSVTKVNRFRCGYCGSPTSRDGSPLTMSQIGLTKHIKEWDEAEKVHGNCCATGNMF